MALLDAELQLLTAFVDGELSGRERTAALHLLNVSSEARSVLQELQENAHRIKRLPKFALESTFANDVVAAIRTAGLKPSLPARRKAPRWAKFAAAACLLIAGGAGLFYLLSTHDGPGDAQRFAVKSLNDEPSQHLLAQQLENRNAVHLQFKVKSNAQAVSRLQNALEDAGVRTIMDSKAQAGLKKESAGTRYLVYAENLNAADLGKILRQIADQEHTGKKAAFETLVVSALSTEQRQDLSNLLGMDAKLLQAPPSGKPGNGEPDPFEQKIIEGPRDKEKLPPSQFTPPDRFALILTDAAGGISQELKSFLAQRKAQRPGTVQVLMVISTV